MGSWYSGKSAAYLSRIHGNNGQCVSVPGGVPVLLQKDWSVSPGSIQHPCREFLEVIGGDEANRGGVACLEELEGSANVVKATPLPIERQFTTPKDGFVSLIGWLTALVSDTTTALVEHGALPWSR